jgi:alkylation response protein AidB-like acyl-CoA dehydrogenase
VSDAARAPWLAAARAHADRLLGAAAAHEASENVPLDVYRALASDGLMAVHVGQARGGAGRAVNDYADAMMLIAAGCASTAVTMAVTNMVGEVLAAFAAPSVSARYCPLLAAGGLGGFALSETNAGSDPAGMRTRATPLPDGGYRLDGDKQWISHGDRATVLVVWARTERGISCFAVPGDAPGISVVRKEDKLGLRASATCALALENVQVGSDALLGEEGRGFRVAMMALDGGRIGIASQAIGIAEAAYDKAVAYSKERKAFGEPIANKQAIQFKIADMAMQIDAAKALTLRAAWLKDQAVKDKSVRHTQESAMAKLYASEIATKVTHQALQVFGGYGYSTEYDMERHYRDARITEIYEGTSEIMRVVIAANALKG